MSDLRDLPEPARYELAKATIEGAMASIRSQLGLSDTLIVAALEAVVGNQKAASSTFLASRLVATVSGDGGTEA